MKYFDYKNKTVNNMKKRIALLADIHGNLESLAAILEDIKVQNIDEIICLGDTIGIGPNSKECVDLLIENNIKSVLGNHEIYLLKGTDFDSTIVGEEKEHYNWVKDSLTNKEINYIKKCPLYYEITISYDNSKFNNKFVLCHYLFESKKNIYPFERDNLRNDINLWKKYNNDNVVYFIGHLHNSFNINEVDGISEDYIADDGTLTNIVIVDSAGCTKDDKTSYMILEISKNIKYERKQIKYNRNKFINKVKSTCFPGKKGILKYFYGIQE